MENPATGPKAKTARHISITSLRIIVFMIIT
jgi:hypothetical protein